MNFFNSMVNFGKRGALGGAIGAGIGYANTGDLGGIAGGAAAGAVMGTVGLPYAKSLLSNKNVTGMGAAALERIGYGGMAAASTIGNRRLFRAATKAKFGISNAASALGSNSTVVNKYGGQALSALGMGSAAMIGSSVISSNRGY